MYLALFPAAVVSTLFNLSFVFEKNDLVHINHFGESVFTTAVVPKRWGREDWEVSELLIILGIYETLTFLWIKCEKEWTLFFILWDECNCSIKFNDLCMCINVECEPNHLFKSFEFCMFQISPQRGSMEMFCFCWHPETVKIGVNWKIN